MSFSISYTLPEKSPGRAAGKALLRKMKALSLWSGNYVYMHIIANLVGSYVCRLYWPQLGTISNVSDKLYHESAMDLWPP